MQEISIKRLTDTAKLPIFAHATDACADMIADETTILSPQERKLISTGVAFNLPEGWEAQIRPRSGLAYKHGITVLNSPGTIDADYRGEVKVLLYNTSDSEFEINQGDRIAQVAFRKVPSVQLVETSSLEETVRADGGFGSTGVSS